MPFQSLFSFKCLVTLFTISSRGPVLLSIFCAFLIIALGRQFFAQTNFFHVSFQSVIILVLVATDVTNAIQTPFMKTFHVTLKPVVVFELLVALFAINCLDGMDPDMVSQSNPVLKFLAANFAYLNVISVNIVIVCF